MDQVKLLLFMLEKAMPAYPGMRHNITLCDQGLELTLMFAPGNFQSITIPTEEPFAIMDADEDLALKTDYLFQEIMTLIGSSKN